MPYKVVPFNASKNPFNATKNVSNTLQNIIDSETSGGYRYINHEYSDKLNPGSAGCFGLGATPDTTIHIGFVIFEKKE